MSIYRFHKPIKPSSYVIAIFVYPINSVDGDSDSTSECNGYSPPSNNGATSQAQDTMPKFKLNGGSTSNGKSSHSHLNGHASNGVLAKTTTHKPPPQPIGKGQQTQITNFFQKTNSVSEQLASKSSTSNGIGHQPRSVSQDSAPSKAYIDGAASSVASNSIDKQPINGGQGSPLRSQLGLNLKTHAPATTKQPSPLQCPLCPYLSDSSNVLEEHINRAHFDPLSPSLNNGSYSASSSDTHQPHTAHNSNHHHHTSSASAMNANGSHHQSHPPHHHDTLTALACPICCQAFESPSDLELHVNIEHRDILSPANADMSNAATNASAATATTDGLTSSFCPVCNILLDHMQTQEMELHIEGHFAKSPQLLATKAETELEKQAQKLREQREFEMLRAQYGMDDQGNFREQSAAGMQRAVYAGEMSVADYYERQVGLRAAESHGIDDGTSCTRSVAPRVASLSAASPNVMRSLVCSAVDHYASSYGDKGWGCGYRNLQMLLSSLLQVRKNFLTTYKCTF